MSSVYISPNRERTTGFPGTGANLRLRERAKGPPPSSLPSLRISTNEEKRRKTLEERSTRIYLAREPPSMVWTNGGNSKKVSNSPRDRVSRSTRKRLPTFLTMDLSFVPIARFASALNGKLVGNRSISQIARPLFLVERSIVNSFRARYVDSSKNQRCSGRDNQLFNIPNIRCLRRKLWLPSGLQNYEFDCSQLGHSRFEYIYFKSKTKDERKI